MKKTTKTSITMKDVAALAGVSVGTVSRVINGEPGIKESTLSKVNAAISELNYIPDVYARGMKMKRTDTIALLVPSIWHPFFGEFAYYVEAELSKLNYKLLLCNINGPKKELEYITMLQQNKVDGIIAITYSPIEEYLASGIPFVSIDRVYSNKEIAWITSDNRHGGEVAAQKLVEKGANVFAFIGSYNSTINETKNRRRGFESYIRREQLPIRILDLEEPVEDFKGQIKSFLASHPEIDGIFAINDFLALEVLEILRELGRRVPEEVQLIGYDGIKMAEDRKYMVSTIKQPLKEMAEEAVKLLISIMENTVHQLQTVLPIAYVEGTTTR